MATPDVDIPNLPNGIAEKSPFTTSVHVESPPETIPDPKYPRLVNPDGTLDDYELEDHFIDDVRPLKVRRYSRQRTV